MPQPAATHVLSSLLWAMARATSREMDPGHWVLRSRTQDPDPGGCILNCWQVPLGQARLPVARGKHALKPKLGAGSRPNKSLIFVWSVLISHTVPPDINPAQARAREGGEAP